MRGRVCSLAVQAHAAWGVGTGLRHTQAISMQPAAWRALARACATPMRSPCSQQPGGRWHGPAPCPCDLHAASSLEGALVMYDTSIHPSIHPFIHPLV
eukprot:356778-Chlamydomonas_euryale.AAC.4